MMRCVQCNRDYPERRGSVIQCGEPLQPRDAHGRDSHPALVEERSPARVEARRADCARGRSRDVGLRARSQSLLFASLVVLGAFAGLALVWRQAWMPSLPRITVSLSREAGAAAADRQTIRRPR